MDIARRAFDQLVRVVREKSVGDEIRKLLVDSFAKTEDSFIVSKDFLILVNRIESAIKCDGTKTFVHVLEFHNELKAYSKGRKEKKKKKKKQPPVVKKREESDYVQDVEQKHVEKKEEKPLSVATPQTPSPTVISSDTSSDCEVEKSSASALKAVSSKPAQSSKAKPEKKPAVDKKCTEREPSASDVAGNQQLIRARGSQSQIARLETLLADLRDRIEELESKELTLDEMEEEDTSYILIDKFKKKLNAVWNKLCVVKGRDSSAGRCTDQKFIYHGSGYPEIDKRIERFVNRKKEFPDYHDILQIIKGCNTKFNLSLSPSYTSQLARQTFVEVGQKLQERSHQDFVANFGCSLTDGYRASEDPALCDPQLKVKLQQNREEGLSRMDTLINKYATRQEVHGDTTDSGEEEDDVDEEKTENMSEGASHACSPIPKPNEESADDLPEPEQDQPQPDLVRQSSPSSEALKEVSNPSTTVPTSVDEESSRSPFALPDPIIFADNEETKRETDVCTLFSPEPEKSPKRRKTPDLVAATSSSDELSEKSPKRRKTPDLVAATSSSDELSEPVIMSFSTPRKKKNPSTFAMSTDDSTEEDTPVPIIEPMSLTVAPPMDPRIRFNRPPPSDSDSDLEIMRVSPAKKAKTFQYHSPARFKGLKPSSKKMSPAMKKATGLKKKYADHVAAAHQEQIRKICQSITEGALRSIEKSKRKTSNNVIDLDQVQTPPKKKKKTLQVESVYSLSTKITVDRDKERTKKRRDSYPTHSQSSASASRIMDMQTAPVPSVSHSSASAVRGSQHQRPFVDKTLTRTPPMRQQIPVGTQSQPNMKMTYKVQSKPKHSTVTHNLNTAPVDRNLLKLSYRPKTAKIHQPAPKAPHTVVVKHNTIPQRTQLTPQQSEVICLSD